MKKCSILLVIFMSIFNAHTFGCQTHCENCTITEITPRASGSMAVTFNNRTNDNPDECGIVSRVIIDGTEPGADVLISTTLSAFVANLEFSAVRTCGCMTEWDVDFPKVAWTKIKR